MPDDAKIWQNGGAMDEWSKDERFLLDALQADDSPTAEDAARMKRRILLGVSAGAATATGVGLAKAGVTGSSLTSVGMKWLWTAGAVATLSAGAYTYSFLKETEGKEVPRTEAPSVAEAPRPAPSEPLRSDSEEEGLSPSEPASAETPLAPTPRKIASNAPQKSESSTATDLKQEAALLSRAQAALQSGDTQAALVALAQHQKDFPRGVLSGEREAAFSIAWCQSGDLERGRARAERFLAKSADSPMVQRLKRACKLPL